MNKEKLNERIKQLEMQKEQCIANFNSIIGALQECNYWLHQDIKCHIENNDKCDDV